MEADFEKLKGAASADILLGALYLLGPSRIQDLKKKLLDEGIIKSTNKWDFSNILKRKPKFATLKNRRDWHLTSAGKSHVEEKFQFNKKKQELSQEMNNILDNMDKKSVAYAYAEEFVGCLNAGYLRASIIMAWAGAIWLLRNHVANNNLKEFNEQAKKEPLNLKKKITNVAGFEKIKDITFLEVCQSADIFSKSESNVFISALSLRNTCSHPTSTITGKTKIIGEIESLILNVYKEY